MSSTSYLDASSDISADVGKVSGNMCGGGGRRGLRRILFEPLFSEPPHSVWKYSVNCIR